MFGLQDWLAAALAMGAAAWLARRAWRRRRRVCAACDSCPLATDLTAGPAATAPPPGFVPLGSVVRYEGAPSTR